MPTSQVTVRLGEAPSLPFLMDADQQIKIWCHLFNWLILVAVCVSSTRGCLALTACVVAVVVAAQSQSLSLLESRLTQRSNISAGTCNATPWAMLVSLLYFNVFSCFSSLWSRNQLWRPDCSQPRGDWSSCRAAQQASGTVRYHRREVIFFLYQYFILTYKKIIYIIICYFN